MLPPLIRHILAVDVGAADEVAYDNYGDSLSGFQVSGKVNNDPKKRKS